jgi:hypothetical protein
LCQLQIKFQNILKVNFRLQKPLTNKLTACNTSNTIAPQMVSCPMAIETRAYFIKFYSCVSRKFEVYFSN